jgi:PKHD-type hydroxylase
MLHVIRQVLPRETALALGRELAGAEWVDGNVTSGEGAALAKRNRQLPEEGPAAARGRQAVLAALAANPHFLSAALPRRIYPPLFNRYGPGEGFGDHVDNAIRVDPTTGAQLRTDLSATLFLSDGYEGGELVIEGEYGAAPFAPVAGDMVLYPSTSLHRVTTVTAGERIACFFWLESLIRDGAARDSLFELDQSIQTLTARHGAADAEVLRLTRVYHNLVRRWV